MIHLQKIRKSYPSEADSGPVLDFEDWRVETGGQVALIGESGSGKTTLLNLLSGLIQPDSGVVSVEGSDLAQLSEAQRDRFRADNIGYVFQSFHLLDGYSVKENVELGAVFAKRHAEPGRAEHLLEAVGLGHRLQHTPRQLSVGQQARVAFARALVNRPKLLLADEPTGALDHESGRQVLDLLLSTARSSGITVVCATHDMDVAAAFENTVRVEEMQ
ncbi:MAG: ABC transporter ATP-binding protein [Planctomycetota bacterium]|jgi:putative ABC transport system ATP-binding protein|nr:ABC transporter ATP-binding protein [Planctomycetota bacterium]